jgi:large subunit ribosomal protein L16
MRVTARQIEATRRAITRHMKRAGRVWIRDFPGRASVSRKPAEVRMGSGKGAPEFWVSARGKPGRVHVRARRACRPTVAKRSPGVGRGQAADQDARFVTRVGA